MSDEATVLRIARETAGKNRSGCIQLGEAV